MLWWTLWHARQGEGWESYPIANSMNEYNRKLIIEIKKKEKWKGEERLLEILERNSPDTLLALRVLRCDQFEFNFWWLLSDKNISKCWEECSSKLPHSLIINVITYTITTNPALVCSSILEGMGENPVLWEGAGGGEEVMGWVVLTHWLQVWFPGLCGRLISWFTESWSDGHSQGNGDWPGSQYKGVYECMVYAVGLSSCTF